MNATYIFNFDMWKIVAAKMCPNDLCKDCISLPPCALPSTSTHYFVSLLSNPGIQDKICPSNGPRQKMSRRRHAHWALHRQIYSCKKHASKMFTSKTSFVSISIVTRPLSLIMYALWIWSLRNKKIMHCISMFSPWDTKCPWNALYEYVYKNIYIYTSIQYRFWLC